MPFLLHRWSRNLSEIQERGAPKKKSVFFWEISPKCGWVGWVIPKQGPNTSKPPQITPKIAFFDPNFTFRSPKSHKNPGVGGWVNTFGRDLPKKNVFFLAASLTPSSLVPLSSIHSFCIFSTQIVVIQSGSNNHIVIIILLRH